MSDGALHAIAGVPLSLLAMCALLLSSTRVAGLLVGGSRPVALLVATIVLAHAQLLAVFELLGVFGAFRLPWVLVVLVAVAALAHRRLPPVSLTARPWLDSLDGVSRGLIVAVVLLLVIKAVRGMVAPTLAMDGTVYHIPRTVLWLGHGGFARLGAPDALEITDFHPPAGDLPWLYALLFARNESLVGWASVFVTVEVFVAAYAVARLLPAGRAEATASALAIACTPAVLVYAGSSYVDNAVLAFVLCGIALLIDTVERPTVGRAFLTSAAFTLAACTKVSAAVLLPLVAVVALVAMWRRARPTLVFGAALGGLLIAPHVARCIALRGSPIYPIGLSLFGHRIFTPNETFELLATGKLFAPARDDLLHFASFLIAPYLRPMDTTGFGVAFVPLAILGAVGAVRMLRGDKRWLGALLTALVVVFLGAVLVPSAHAYRTEYAHVVGRYLTTALASLSLLALAIERRWVRSLLLACAAVSYLSSIPRGMRALDAVAIAPVAGAFVLVLLLTKLLPRGRIPIAIGGAWLVHLVSLGARATHRDDYLTALSSRSIYDIHGIGFTPPGTGRVWQALDRQPPSRIAINSGWTGEGMQLMITPLLGEQLQHTHLWVTPTADGSVIDYRRGAELRARANYDAWRRRLHEQRVDIVACLAPPGLERWWIELHPQHFELIAASNDGGYAAFRVRRDP